MNDKINSSRIKRKADHDTENTDDEISITEDIKKVRISTTPGLLRAQKDIKEFDDSFQSGVCPVELQISHGEQAVLCVFRELPLSCPNMFRISIPRFYPHSRPTVHCLTPFSGSIDTFSHKGQDSMSISPDSGLCSHFSLAEGWMATMTLRDVVEVLENLALVTGQGGNPHASMCSAGDMRDREVSMNMSPQGGSSHSYSPPGPLHGLRGSGMHLSSSQANGMAQGELERVFPPPRRDIVEDEGEGGAMEEGGV